MDKRRLEGLSGLRGSRSSVARAVAAVGVLAGMALVFAPGALAAAPEAPETLVPTQVSDTTAVLGGVLNPHASGPAAGSFVYSPGAACEGAGSRETAKTSERELEARQFSVQLSGLTAGEKYTVCAVATNGEGGRTLGAGQSFQTEAAGPEVSAVIQHLTNESLTLRVTVSTHGEPGSLSVQYGTTLSYGSESEPRKLTPAPDPTEDTVTLQGLDASTRYHLHVVASTILPGEASSSDMTVVTQATPVPGLPDGRHAELVTPLDGNDQGVAVPSLGKGFEESDGAETSLPFAVSEDGSRVTYVAGPVPGGSGSNGSGELGNQFLASRVNGRWENQILTPAGYYNARYEAFNPTLEIGVLNIRNEETLPPIVPQAPDNTNVLYTKALPAGAFTPMFTERPAHYLDTNGEEYVSELYPLFFGGASEDFKTLLFSADGVLGSNAVEPAGEEDNLYVSRGGRVEAVNVLPGQAVSTPDATFGAPTLSGLVSREMGPDLDHVISADGTRVLWTDLVNHNLYMRIDPLTSEAHTVQVDLAAGGGGEFWAANRDDSEVLFTKSGSLYLYNANTGLTADIVPGGEVVGVLGASEEVGPLHVYFVSRAALTSRSTPVSCDVASENVETREVSLCNLYEYSPETESGPRFIAQLEANDGVRTPPYLNGGTVALAGDWQPDLGARTAEVTPNGEDLLFVSQARIPTAADPEGYDNVGREKTIPTSQNPEGYIDEDFSEVYLFSRSSGETTCLSCGTEGQPIEVASKDSQELAGGYLPISSQSTFQPRLMSANGRRVFFDSSQALSPLDTNGHTDVYEWEADEEGSCKLAEGCASLLTGGTSPKSSFLIGASASGNDVFVSSRAPLAGQQLAGDGVAQLYDLRVPGAEESGASPALGECAPHAQCSFGAEGLAAVGRPATETTEAVGDFPAVQPVAGPKAKKKAKSKPKHPKVKRCRRPSRLNKKHKCVAPLTQRSRRHSS